MARCFTAQFSEVRLEKQTELLRYDTRLWFDTPPEALSSAVCVGAVVGLNPGSAGNGKGGYCLGSCDPTMDRVLTTFEIAYELRKESVPLNSYVQMLNLFYLREVNSAIATDMRDQNINCFQDNRDFAEDRTYPFLWLAWGQSAKNEDVARFLQGRQEKICWVGSDLEFHFESPVNAYEVRHPLCRTAGFSMRHNAEMVAQMLSVVGK